MDNIYLISFVLWPAPVLLCANMLIRWNELIFDYLASESVTDENKRCPVVGVIETP
jgi:hypothetical protein